MPLIENELIAVESKTNINTCDIILIVFFKLTFEFNLGVILLGCLIFLVGRGLILFEFMHKRRIKVGKSL